MPDLLPISLHEMLTEVRRELGLRKRVYPNRVNSGRMSAEKASKHMEIMEAIALYLEERMAEERKKGNLPRGFDDPLPF